MKHFTT